MSKLLADSTDTLKADLSQMLTSGTDSDLTISVQSDEISSVGPRTFEAHSFILKARSPYFRAMLSTPMAESSSRQITENEVRPEVMEEVLKYIYTGSLSEGATAAMGEWLMLAADKYCICCLKQLCEAHLCQDLGARNAAARLVLSDQTNADELKEACVAFIKENAAEVMETSGWSKVASYQAGSLALEVMRAMAGLSRPGKKRPSPGSQDPAASSSSQVNSRARWC
jgi:speckle-type POZ protein